MRYVFIPDHGKQSYFRALDDHEAAVYASKRFHGCAGALYRLKEYCPPPTPAKS